MLVKFLSFIASVLSNARYKAVLIPCAIVVLSISSLTAVALVHDSGSHSATSAARQTDKTNTDTTQSPLSPQIGSSSQDAKDKDSAQQPIAKEPISSKPADGNSGQTPNPSESQAPDSVKVTLSAHVIAIEADGFTRPITATASDGNSLTWTVTPESGGIDGLQAVAEGQETAPTFSFRFRAAQSLQAGQYRFVLTAKDAARGIEVSKVIIVTVNSQ